MRDDELTIVPPDKARREELYDLIAKVFSGPSYFSFRDYCRDAYMGRGFYDWSASRVGILDGRIVSHWGIWNYRMRIGSTPVRVAGIGAVATHADYRKHGLMARTAGAGIEAMRAAGYDLSILFGIRNFYHRFGYVRAWSELQHFVAAANLPAEKPAGAIREFVPRRREDLSELYNRLFAGLTGTAVRPTFIKGRVCQPWRGSQRRRGYEWAGQDKNGKLAGYVIAARDGRRMECVEACGDAVETLRVIALLARRWSCDDVRFDALPYDHPLARLLRRGDCRLENQYVRNGGAMIRTVNLASALGKLAGELGGRLARSSMAGWRGTLCIDDKRQRVWLAIGPGGIRVAPSGAGRHAIIGGDRIAQLLIGTDRPEEVIEEGGMTLRGDAADLAEALFPAQHPILGSWDRF